MGAASVIAPAYIAEISPASIRGRLGSLQQLAIVFGIFVALLSDYFLSSVAGGSSEALWGSVAWRWMFWIEIIPAVIYGVLALTIPESPRYLVSRNEIARARAVLRSVMTRGVNDRIAEIQRTARREARSSIRDLLGANNKVLPIVWIGSTLR